jgi:hypothetical protein
MLLCYRGIAWIGEVEMRPAAADLLAASPVAGPFDVVGTSGADVLDEDLRVAALAALAIPRDRCRAHALNFTWRQSATQFLENLRPCRRMRCVGRAVPS